METGEELAFISNSAIVLFGTGTFAVVLYAQAQTMGLSFNIAFNKTPEKDSRKQTTTTILRQRKHAFKIPRCKNEEDMFLQIGREKKTMQTDQRFAKTRKDAWQRTQGSDWRVELRLLVTYWLQHVEAKQTAQVGHG